MTSPNQFQTSAHAANVLHVLYDTFHIFHEPHLLHTLALLHIKSVLRRYATSEVLHDVRAVRKSQPTTYEKKCSESSVEASTTLDFLRLQNASARNEYGTLLNITKFRGHHNSRCWNIAKLGLTAHALKIVMFSISILCAY